jgi:hypothetical protein
MVQALLHAEQLVRRQEQAQRRQQLRPEPRPSPLTNAEREAVPPHLRCPLTQELFLDPVVIASGHTYERAAIKLYLQASGADPVTKEQLEYDDVVPSLSMQKIAQAYYADVIAARSRPQTRSRAQSKHRTPSS